ADRFGSEEGNESQFGGEDFFPELIVGPLASSQPVVGEDQQPNLAEEQQTTENAVSQTDAPAPAAGEAGTDDKTPKVMATGIATIGLMIGVFLLVVLLLSVFVLRPR
ncbi:MAG: hypothetical protein VB855_19525, partial [Pirellulaceae bacterium]